MMSKRFGTAHHRWLHAVSGLIGILVLSGCPSGASPREPLTLKIGYVSPQTGALARFGEADAFAVNHMSRFFQTHPLRIADATYRVEIIMKDSRSDPAQAGEAARDLIRDDQVDLMLVAATAQTVNPVADQCEASGVPCISTASPWQSFVQGRGASKNKPFTWTYHFFWGLDDVASVYEDMWSNAATNKKAAALWPNDPDGTLWSDPANGVVSSALATGISVIDPVVHPTGTRD
jgi:branched-chain amino acid transport system substrate-binding protein